MSDYIVIRVFLEDYGLFCDIPIDRRYENFIGNKVNGRMFHYYSGKIVTECETYEKGNEHYILLLKMREHALNQANSGREGHKILFESQFGKKPDYYFSSSH